jgi:hypothetical protein
VKESHGSHILVNSTLNHIYIWQDNRVDESDSVKVTAGLALTLYYSIINWFSNEEHLQIVHAMLLTGRYLLCWENNHFY